MSTAYLETPMLNDEKCWQAVASRSATEDGHFFFGVVTTGVYCRPSCPARQPLRQNVRFYETAGAAEKDGLRPCLRCRPLKGRADEPALEKIRDLCRHIRANSASGEPLTLAALGESAGWSPFHLQRTFKAVMGVSPKHFIEACRLATFKSQLRAGVPVTAAVYDAGFGSSSRVYERVDAKLGMTPMEYKTGGKYVEISYAFAKTPLGLMLVGATDRGLCFVQFGDTESALLEEMSREYPAAAIAPSASKSRELEQWMTALTRYLQGEPVPLQLPLDVQATTFRMKVWHYLQTIPRGEVRTYAEVARAVGEPRAARAVGTACGSNLVALVIPCHRVIRGDHGLGGYRWGLDRKKKLLAAEQITTAS